MGIETSDVIKRDKLFLGICMALLPTAFSFIIANNILNQLITEFILTNAPVGYIGGGEHVGSHPHLAHEFVSAIREKRVPYPNAVQAANWTCVGLLAHESSMNGRNIKRLPKFTLST